PCDAMMGSNSTPERRNHEDVARAPTLGAPLAYCSKSHAAMPETRALASSHHRSAPSRGSPAPCGPRGCHTCTIILFHRRLARLGLGPRRHTEQQHFT